MLRVLLHRRYHLRSTLSPALNHRRASAAQNARVLASSYRIVYKFFYVTVTLLFISLILSRKMRARMISKAASHEESVLTLRKIKINMYIPGPTKEIIRSMESQPHRIEVCCANNFSISVCQSTQGKESQHWVSILDDCETTNSLN